LRAKKAKLEKSGFAATPKAKSTENPTQAASKQSKITIRVETP
jgi:hypothetical protein